MSLQVPLILGLTLIAAAGDHLASADDTALELESQAEQLLSIEQAAQNLSRFYADYSREVPDSVASHALQSLVQALFSDDEIVSEAAQVALRRRLVRTEFDMFPWNVPFDGGAGLSINDARALGLVHAALHFDQSGVDGTPVWAWCRPRILEGNADMRKAGAWTATSDDPASAILFLQQLSKDEDHEVRLAATHLLGLTCLYMRERAFEEYSELGLSLVQQRVGDPHEDVRKTAFDILAFACFRFEMCPSRPRNLFRVPNVGDADPFQEEILARYQSQIPNERMNALYMITFLDRPGRESVDAIVHLLRSAAEDVQLNPALDAEPLRYPDLGTVPRWWTTAANLTAIETANTYGSQIGRLLRVASTTPEGLEAIRRLHDVLKNNVRLRTRCTAALLVSGEFSWADCRIEMLAAFEELNDRWFTREILMIVMTYLDRETAARVFHDVDVKFGTSYHAEFVESTVEFESVLQTLESRFASHLDQERASDLTSHVLPQDIESLVQILDPEMEIDEHESLYDLVEVLESIEEYGHNATVAIPPVIRFSMESPSTIGPYWRAIAIRCLGHIATIDDEGAVAALRHHLRNGGMSIRTEAAFALARMGIVDNEVMAELEWLESNGPFQLREQYTALLRSADSHLDE